MKKLNSKQIILMAVLLVASLLTVAFPEFTAEVITFLGLGGTAGVGVSLGATTYVTGSVSRTEADKLDPEHLARYVMQGVIKKKPSKYPLDTVIRNIGKTYKATSEKVEYEEVTYREWEGAVATGGGFTADTSTSASVTLDNVDFLAAGDVIEFRGITGGDGSDHQGIVTAVNTSTKAVTFTGINGSTGQQIPDIAEETVVYRVGSSANEFLADFPVKYALPENAFNYCQRILQQLERSVIEAQYKTYSGYGYQDKREQALYDFRGKCEKTWLFGVKGKSTVGAEVEYTAGGIYNSIGQSLEFGTGGSAVDPTDADIHALGEFTAAGKASSDEKLLIVGKKLATGLANTSTYERNISGKDKSLWRGIMVDKLTTPFCEINVVYDPLMDLHGKANEGVLIDTEYIRKHDFIPFNVSMLELKKAGKRNVQDAMLMEEISCVTTHYAGAGGVHAIWKPKLTT